MADVPCRDGSANGRRSAANHCRFQTGRRGRHRQRRTPGYRALYTPWLSGRHCPVEFPPYARSQQDCARHHDWQHGSPQALAVHALL